MDKKDTLLNEEEAAVDIASSRRDFIKTFAAAGAGLILPASVQAQAGKPAAKPAAKPAPAKPAAKPSAAAPKIAAPKQRELKIALIGAGSQGRNLMVNCLRAENVRFVAICDIWPYSQQYAANILKRYEQPVRVYSDHKEMLEKEAELDAVIIATPDWVHAEQTVDCLRAGKHVYCEKEMSNTLEGARQMVLAQRETGKLLQIGHQRRSNPRYWHGDKLIHNDKMLGRITHAYGQWNRSRRLELGWPKNHEMDKETLQKHGYDTMEQFRNWRWYKKYSGGPIADLGSHQIDIFSWFLRAHPKAVQATGGADYYKDRDWYDNAMALYEYETEQGPVRAFYQVLNTTSYGGYYEVFMGDNGSLEISEDTSRGLIYPEPVAKAKVWEDEAKKVETLGKVAILLQVGESLGAGGKDAAQAKKLAADVEKPPHLLHLENFFDAIRKGTPLSCPPEIGYETAVAVLRVNDAIATGQKVTFKPEDFKV